MAPCGALDALPKALDRSGTAITVYAIGWRIEDGDDIWTRRFLGFKAKQKGAVRAAAH